MYFSIWAVLVFTIFTSAASAQGVAPSEPQTQLAKDKQFLEYAAEDNQAEIRLSQNAQKLAQSPAVIAFARLMATDDTDLQNKLDELINKNQIKILPDMVQQEASKVAPKIGVTFDTAFVAAQIEHHRNDVMRFQNEQSAAQNDDVRQFAARALPVLEQQLALAQAVQAWIASPQAQITGRSQR